MIQRSPRMRHGTDPIPRRKTLTRNWIRAELARLGLDPRTVLSQPEVADEENSDADTDD